MEKFALGSSNKEDLSNSKGSQRKVDTKLRRPLRREKSPFRRSTNPHEDGWRKVISTCQLGHILCLIWFCNDKNLCKILTLLIDCNIQWKHLFVWFFSFILVYAFLSHWVRVKKKGLGHMLLLKPWDVLQIHACRRQGRISMGVAKRKRKKCSQDRVNCFLWYNLLNSWKMLYIHNLRRSKSWYFSMKHLHVCCLKSSSLSSSPKSQNKKIRLGSFHHHPEWQNKSITLGQKRYILSVWPSG